MVQRHLDHDWFSRPLPENLTMGSRSWLYSSYAFVHYQSEMEIGVAVGHDTGIYHGTFFELGQNGHVLVGNYCSLVGAIIASNHKVEIGSYSLIAHEVVIADHEYYGVDLLSSAPPRQGSPTGDIVIGENVWIGSRATILGGVNIGEGAIIGAAAVVRENVPPYAIYAGNPGRIVGESAANENEPRA